MVTYPFKIYQKEISVLAEIQLEETAEIAFRDLLLDLSSYIDAETFEPYTATPEKTYTIHLGKNREWNYLAIWELDCKPTQDSPSPSALLKANLTLIPTETAGAFTKLPTLKKAHYKYFIEKKPKASQGEANGEREIL